MRTSKIVFVFLLALALAILASGAFVWRAVTLERSEPSQALRELAAVRETFGTAEPMLRIDASGQVVRGAPKDSSGGSLSQLKVLAYRVNDQRLMRGEVPFWWVKLKGPALRLILRGTDFDLNELGVTTADLEEHGPGLVLDETRPNGDRLLVWTE